ncbi:MAG: hypothetical protein HKN52_07670 [Eudoraea sp.]|nr:hypothetical protein [Eudoraea sp.]
MKQTNKLLILALVIGVAFHGSALFFTLETTYDALIHLFFADHYANSWWDPWEYRWYTGFTVMGYPPLAHQLMALFSFLGGLKFGLYAVALGSIALFITGVYRFGLLLTGNRKIAGYTALLAVFSSTFLETLHVFGQLPSIIGLSVLLHALPEIYLWVRKGSYFNLATALSLIAVTVTSHHVTPIFGMVFFIFPLIGMAIMDDAKEKVRLSKKITLVVFIASFRKLFWRIVGFGLGSLVLIIGCILPYWLNSKENPITQVPIPHGSRDNFLEVTSSGLVFFIIPWGILLFLLPYIFYRFYSKRYLFFGLSISLLTLLGTGGTTPIPRMILGETAFDILTLDRFTLWATIMALPIFGEFVFRIIEGDLKEALRTRVGPMYHRIVGALLAGAVLFMVIFTMSLGYFRPSQPQKIKMLPIVNFLNQDMHDQWRYLTLGFGDQMAWLSAQTNAMTVDGNYHSARRLPELTSKAIERLENSKFRGVEGIGSLQQFLTIPEKYRLKYIFSNDKFYDPILYYCGWQRLQLLENGIMVWEKLNVPPLPAIIPKDEVPLYLKIMWGVIPLLTIVVAFIFNIQLTWIRALKSKSRPKAAYMDFSLKYTKFSPGLLKTGHIWVACLLGIFMYSAYQLYLVNTAQRSPENVIKAYYDAIDFKEYEKAHSYLDPSKGVTLAQYMLEVSVDDGILSSYGKLDSIGVQITKQSSSKAKAEINTVWITPLETIQKQFTHELIKDNSEWFIVPSKPDADIPSDQLFTTNSTGFYNHGRRRITTQQTHHEDVLQQPVLEVLSARLVKFGTEYAIVGELQNIDHVPADVVIKATLYNESDKELVNYNAKYHIKHKLMPKEVTSFRINFESIAWSQIENSMPATYDPKQFSPISLEESPLKFNLQCAGNVAVSDLYKDVAVQKLVVHDTYLEGAIFNGGNQEVTIPQLLVSYYDTGKNLLWVDHKFITKGIRVQRKQFFDYTFKDLSEITVINSDLSNCFVNGLPNSSISQKVFPNRDTEHTKALLQEKSTESFEYFKIELNNYIGNPR